MRRPKPPSGWPLGPAGRCLLLLLLLAVSLSTQDEASKVGPKASGGVPGAPEGSGDGFSEAPLCPHRKKSATLVPSFVKTTATAHPQKHTTTHHHHHHHTSTTTAHPHTTAHHPHTTTSTAQPTPRPHTTTHHPHTSTLRPTPHPHTTTHHPTTSTLRPTPHPHTTSHHPHNTSTLHPHTTTHHPHNNTSTLRPTPHPHTTTHHPHNTTSTLRPTPRPHTTTHHPHNTTSTLRPTPQPHTNQTTAPATSHPHTDTPVPTQRPSVNVGMYEVRNGSVVCLRAQMGLQLQLRFVDRAKQQLWGEFVVQPNHTQSNGTCSDKTASLLLNFSEGFLNFTFQKNETQNTFYLSRIQANLTYQFSQATETSFSADNASLHEFEALLGHSYQCRNRSVALKEGFRLDVLSERVQPFGLKDGQFGEADVCPEQRRSSTVPIVVGVLLGLLILIVVIAFLVGRRRAHSGYQTL